MLLGEEVQAHSEKLKALSQACEARLKRRRNVDSPALLSGSVLSCSSDRDWMYSEAKEA